MTPEDRQNVTYRRQRYRSRERRLEITPDQVDNIPVEEGRGKTPMEEERDDGKEFAQLLKSMQELTKRIEEIRQKFVEDNKHRKIPREFQIEEGSGTITHLSLTC